MKRFFCSVILLPNVSPILVHPSEFIRDYAANLSRFTNSVFVTSALVNPQIGGIASPDSEAINQGGPHSREKRISSNRRIDFNTARIVPGVNYTPIQPVQPNVAAGAPGPPKAPPNVSNENGGTADSPSVHDYRHLHKDPRILVDPNNEISFNTNPNRRDLCSICLCSQDSSKIVCEHRHPISEDSEHTLIISKQLLPREAIYLQIRGYDQVTVEEEAFAKEESFLKLIAFENVDKLLLKPNSFLFSPKARENTEVVIQFRECGIPKFPQGCLTQMEGGRHGTQGRVKLERTRFLSVEFIKCKIGIFESNSMNNARCIYFNISDSEIQSIGKKAIDLDVYELCKIKKNTLPTLQPESMCFHAKKTVFSGNTMGDVHNSSIMIETDSQVLFEFNHVKKLYARGLAGIRPMDDGYGASIVFLMNYVEYSEPFSLYIDPAFPPHERKVLNNSFLINCECNITSKFMAMMGITDNYPYDRTSYESVIENSLCLGEGSNKFVYVDVFQKENCQPFPVITVSAVSAAVLFFIIAVTVCVICSLRIHQVKEEINTLGECTSQSFSTLSRNYNDYEGGGSSSLNKYPEGGQWNFPAWVAAVPEVKTYQQDRLPDFTERAESICGTIRGLDPIVEHRVLARASCPPNN